MTVAPCLAHGKEMEMIGRAYSLKRLVVSKGKYRGPSYPEIGLIDGCDIETKDWLGGTLYEYGLLPPNYPVPAIYAGKNNPAYWNIRAQEKYFMFLDASISL